MKENDWIVAGINNPDSSPADFLMAGLNVTNTQLLPKDTYKKSNYIKDKFTEDGKFNESAFDDFYKKKASEYDELLTTDISDKFVYSPFDPRSRGAGKRVRSLGFEFNQTANPNRETKMFTGDIYKDTYSDRERAQNSKIWDTAKLEWSEDTLNDRSLVKDPLKWIETVFGDPLVYATYDKDTDEEDPFTGQMVHHTKGEYKLNQYGLPYTETLNGRSLIGKEVVTAGDIMTIDHQGIDKYNFFDSDDLDKSVTGTIMKTVASVAPLFMGPYVSAIYSGALIGKEMLKTLPMLYGITTAWTDLPQDNSLLNRLAATGEVFTSSTSDAGKASVLNLETLASMVSDIALQYGQLKVIAQSIGKLRGSNKLMEDAYGKAFDYYKAQRANMELQKSLDIISLKEFETFVGADVKGWAKSAVGAKAIEKFTKEVEPIVKFSNRLGADASLAYMALVSNTDVYQSMLEAGASKSDAAAVTLGSTLGMFAIDKYAHLGELFFDDLTADYEKLLRRTLKKEAGSWYNEVINKGIVAGESEGSKLRRLINKGVQYGKKQTSQFIEDLKYHSTGFLGKALGEGIEEVGEEVVTDLSKSIYELAGKLGADTSIKDAGAWDDMAARYGMSFLGGALGGGLFYGVDVYQNGKFNVDTTLDELIYLVRNGKTKDVLKTLDDWHKKGKLGSKNLSVNVVKGLNDENIFASAKDDGSDSQNDFIYKRIRETVLSLENIINENNANLNEDELFNNMVLSEARFINLRDYLQKASYTTGYLQVYQNILNNIANLEGSLQRASLSIDGIDYTDETQRNEHIATDEQLRHLNDVEKKERNRNLQKIQDKLDESRKKLQSFLSGEQSIYYTEKMLFALDSRLNNDFITMTFDLWLAKKHNGKTIDELAPLELETYKEEYWNYVKNGRAKELDDKFAIYQAIKKKINPTLLKISENKDNFKKFQESLNKIRAAAGELKTYSYDDVLDFMGETKESDAYVNRYNEDYNLWERQDAIDNKNNEEYEKFRNVVLKAIKDANGYIDPATRRELRLIINRRNKDVVKYLVSKFRNKFITLDPVTHIITYPTEEQENIINLLSTISDKDLDKEGKVWLQIKDLVSREYRDRLVRLNSKFGKVHEAFNDAGSFGVYDGEYGNEAIKGSEILKFILNLLDAGYTIDEIFNLNTEKNGTRLYDEIDMDILPNVESWILEVRAMYESGKLDSYNFNELSSKEFLEALDNDQELLTKLNEYRTMYLDFIESIRNNSVLKLNNELDTKVKDVNPIMDLVKALAFELNIDSKNIENVLKKIEDRYENIDDLNDFTISDSEKLAFKEATQLINLARAYIYATSPTRTILSPFGHNSLLNDFAKKHSDIYKNWQELAVLPADVAAVYDMGLQGYLAQMEIDNEGNVKGMWGLLSLNNEANKKQQHVKADRAWNLTCYDLFASNRNAFKFEFAGLQIDLLEGFESIPIIDKNSSDAPVHLNKLFNLFHENLLKLINKGWTYNEIWERSQIIDKITKIDKVLLLKTASLDENVTKDTITDFDKVMILCTVGAMDSTNFYKYMKNRIELDLNIVPLTIQIWLTRMGIARQENSKIFDSALEYVKSKNPNEKRPIIKAFYTSGDPGGGKSRVIARNIANYIEEGDVWLAAPKITQANTLLESVGKGFKFTIKETDTSVIPNLFEKCQMDIRAINDAQDKLKLFRSDQEAMEAYALEQDPYFTIEETDEAFVIIPNFDKFGIKKINNAPKMLVIDEVTHLSSLQIQLLAKWCEVNDTKLILIGDNKQLGYDGRGRNIQREQCIIARSQDLGISLRDNNILHDENLRKIKGIILELANLDKNLTNSTAYYNQVKTILNLIQNIKFKVYKGNELKGDCITSSLTTDLVKKLSGKIGYVGGQSETLSKLQSANLDVTVMSSEDVQGLEFDYIVIDKNFTYPSPTNASALQILNFLQDVYTMISRGRNGSIIVDSSSQMESTIGQNRVEMTTAPAPKISSYLEEFTKKTLDYINKIVSGETLTNLKKPSQQGTNLSATQTNTLGTNTLGTNSQGTASTNTPTNNPPASNPPVGNTNSSGTNSGSYTPNVIMDKDFDPESLNYEDNVYAIFLTNDTGVNVIISNNAFPDINNAKKQLLEIKTAHRMLGLIEKIKSGNGFNHSDTVVLFEFSKDKLGSSLESVLQALINDGNDSIPINYIGSIIRFNIETNLDEIITNEEEQALLPIIPTPEEIQAVSISPENIGVNSEDFDDVSIMAHGEATFTGFQVEIEETDKGKRLIWHNPKNGIKRDAQLFTDEEVISNDDEQIRLTHQIESLKQAFLYKNEWSTLPQYVKNFISEEDFNNVKWFIEVRPLNDQDNFIRTSSFKELRTIGNKNLVYSVVGVLPDKNGYKRRFTLGLMSDPYAWINKITSGKVKERIDKKIAKIQKLLDDKNFKEKTVLDTLRKKIDYYHDYLNKMNLDDPNSMPRKYLAYIESLESRQLGNEPLVIPIPDITFTAMTGLDRLDNVVPVSKVSRAIIENIRNYIAGYESEIKSLEKSRPEGWSGIVSRYKHYISNAKEKLKGFEESLDQSFHSLNPSVVVSPMYIYTPQNKQLGIDDSVMGRCNVIFVTKDRSLRSEDLCSIYISQRNAITGEVLANGIADPKTSLSKPKVRCIVLNNLGVSFLDLSNPYLKDSMTSVSSYIDSNTGKTIESSNIFPFKTHFMGVRMYVGLWNFRANLLNFQDNLTKFVETLPIDKSSLDVYLKVKDLLYRKNKKGQLEAEEEDYLASHLNLEKQDEVFKMIDDFNLSLNSKVKQFRLGSDLSNGAYIRKFDGDVSTFYADASHKNGIYINTETLEKYIGISEHLFGDILDNIVKCDLSENEDGKRFLMTANTGYKNSYSNHITELISSNGSIQILNGEETPITLHFNSQFDPDNSRGIMNSFSHIPAVLSKVFKYISERQTYDIENESEFYASHSVKITTTSVNSEGKTLQNVEKEISYSDLANYVGVPIPLSMSSGDDVVKVNHDLSNFFSFAFHGTLEDVSKKDVQRASDALFPKGFYADPLSTTEKNSGPVKYFTKAVLQDIFFGVDVRVSNPIFYINLDTLGKAIENSKLQVLTPKIDASEKIKRIDDLIALYPKLGDLLNNLREDLINNPSEDLLEWVDDEISDAIEKVAKDNINNLFSGAIKNPNPEDFNNIIIGMDSDKNPISLQTYILNKYQEKFKKDLPPITSVTFDNGKLSIEAGDDVIIVNKTKEGVINIERKTLTSGDFVESAKKSVSEMNFLTPKEKKKLNDLIKQYEQLKDSNRADAAKQLIVKSLNEMAYSPKYASSQNAFDKLTGLLKEIDKYCNG